MPRFPCVVTQELNQYLQREDELVAKEQAREGYIRDIAAELAVFDFEEVDKLTGNHFLQWFYDQCSDSNYFAEFHDLALRHPAWAALHALELASDYVDYLEGLG